MDSHQRTEKYGIVYKDYVIEGFLGMGKLSDCKDEMDYLVLENYLLAKPDQPVWERNDNWQNEFELD